MDTRVTMGVSSLGAPARAGSDTAAGARLTTDRCANVKPIPIDLDVPDGRWEHDASHFPQAAYPLDSLAFGLVQAATLRWAEEFGYLFDGLEMCDIGGWTYQRLRPIGGREGRDLPGPVLWLLVRVMPTMRRRMAAARDAVRSDKAGRSIRRWEEAWLPELDAEIVRLRSVDRGVLTATQLEEHLDQAIRLVGRGIEIHALVHGSLALILHELFTTCRRLLGWEMERVLELVQGTSFKSTEPARALHDLARFAARRPELLEPVDVPEEQFLEHLRGTDEGFGLALESYLEAYGHRALRDSVAEPTIAERPSLVVTLLRDQLAQGYDPATVDAQNRATREAATKRARERLAGDPRALAQFERVLARAVSAYPAREDNEFYTLNAPFGLLRYALLELGARLVRQGVIDEREDVVYLDIDEVREAHADGRDRRDKVAQRKGQRAWAELHPGPATYGPAAAIPSSLDFLPADARSPMQAMLWSLESMLAIDASRAVQAPGTTSIRGRGVSNGSYTGPVRVVMDESQFGRIQAGDVLVCRITSPVWSVVFPSVGALVTDSGGPLSHPAIIAREYRIPAVVATGNGTSLLHDGEIVHVDGTAGTVTVDSAAPADDRARKGGS